MARIGGDEFAHCPAFAPRDAAERAFRRIEGSRSVNTTAPIPLPEYFYGESVPAQSRNTLLWIPLKEKPGSSMYHDKLRKTEQH